MTLKLPSQPSLPRVTYGSVVGCEVEIRAGWGREVFVGLQHHLPLKHHVPQKQLTQEGKHSEHRKNHARFSHCLKFCHKAFAVRQNHIVCKAVAWSATIYRLKHWLAPLKRICWHRQPFRAAHPGTGGMRWPLSGRTGSRQRRPLRWSCRRASWSWRRSCCPSLSESGCWMQSPGHMGTSTIYQYSLTIECCIKLIYYYGLQFPVSIKSHA